jgi:2,3-bisphosphoglycerate-independent phosphoglycerate mutase
MEKIKIIGMKDLNEDELEVVKGLANEYYEKLQRIIKNIDLITIHVKTFDATGERKRYEIKLKVIAPTKSFDAQSSEWDITKAVHIVFNEMQKVIEHRFHD